MKKSKQRFRVSYLIAALALMMSLGTVGMSVSYAATSASVDGNPMSGLVTALAKKFNLNETDVKKVFNEQKTQMDAQRQQKMTERLNQAVKDGQLTQDQADKISAKMKKLESQKMNLSGKTEQERHDAMKKQMDSLKQWATDNSIPMQYLPFGFRMHGHGHPGKDFNEKLP